MMTGFDSSLFRDVNTSPEFEKRFFFSSGNEPERKEDFMFSSVQVRLDRIVWSPDTRSNIWEDGKDFGPSVFLACRI